MIKLLLLRAAPLFLRPLAVAMEGFFFSDGYVLTLLLPIVAIAHTISSIPVHVDFFRSSPKEENYTYIAFCYSSSLSIMIALGFVVLCACLFFIPGKFSGAVTSIILVTFIIEKLSDEICRRLEFQKLFFKWFLIQTIRSGWVFFPILLSVFFQGFYHELFLVFSVFSLGVIYYLLRKIAGINLVFSLEGVENIRKNFVYITASVLSATYRQAPRLFMSVFFPSKAHIFLAVAQLCQGVSLLFSVRYQIPYRKAIAKKTYIMQSMLFKIMSRMILFIVAVAFCYILFYALGTSADFGGWIFGLALVPIMTVDALTFSILQAYLGYLPWLKEGGRSFITYLSCLLMAIIALLVLYFASQMIAIVPLVVPVISIFMGLVWISIIFKRHFVGRP